jgi:hypothetical protein
MLRNAVGLGQLGYPVSHRSTCLEVRGLRPTVAVAATVLAGLIWSCVTAADQHIAIPHDCRLNIVHIYLQSQHV